MLRIVAEHAPLQSAKWEAAWCQLCYSECAVQQTSVFSFFSPPQLSEDDRLGDDAEDVLEEVRCHKA